MSSYYQLISCVYVKLLVYFNKKKLSKLQNYLQLTEDQVGKLSQEKIYMLVNYHFQKQNPSTIFVFDDTIKDTTYMKSPVMLGLLTEGRH